MAAGPQKGFKNEINVTPLVDVVLVLLIIFMVVTPMLQRGKDVQLPTAKKIEGEKSDADPLILSVTFEKTTWVEQDQYDDNGLSERLSSEMMAQPGRKVMIKGDQRLTFGDVRKVMEISRKAGAKSVSLAVEEFKEE